MFKLQYLAITIWLFVGFVVLAHPSPITAANKPLQQSQSKNSTPNQSYDLNRHVEPGEVPDGLSSRDWANIQTQFQESRYRAFKHEEGGFTSANPAHNWQIHYRRNGSTTLMPLNQKAGAYQLEFKLKAVGYEQLEAFNHPTQVSAKNNMISYQWNEILREFWINQESNLEQWFALERRPADAVTGFPLTLQLALNSDLVSSQDGNTVYFTSQPGTSFTTRISYDKLKVWDNTGSEIPARMQLQNNILSLVIDDSLAQYPITIDPVLAQQAYLKASNTEIDDSFGESVALSGDTLVVGAHQEDSNATGVNGDQANNSILDSGAAYVFIREAGVWRQQAYLKASNTGLKDHFGQSVAISGDTLVVGAEGEDSDARGINGDQSNNLAEKSGAAYVFIRKQGVWNQQAYLKASNTEFSDQFGWSVAISGDTLVVGAHQEGSSATGVNGNQDDNSAWDSGAAYVFTREDGVWSQQAYLKASNTEILDRFGESVAVSEDTLVVGAEGEDSNATGVNGDQGNNLAENEAGAAYVFTRTTGDWSQQAYLKASNTGVEDEFGHSVAVSGNLLVVGAHREDSNAAGVNGDQDNDLAESAGAAYVFGREEGVWSQQAYLKASNPDRDDTFGNSVAISKGWLVVGARREESNATGVDGDQSNNFSSDSGAAYVFTRATGVWDQQAYLKASNTEARDNFGNWVAISGDTLVVAAHHEDSNATGVDGDETNNLAGYSGAVYMFEFFDLIFADSFEGEG